MCAWTAPRDWTVGETVTEDMMDEQVKGNMRYLKGLDGLPTIESGLVIDNTDGDERLLLPLLSTAECTTVLNAEGEVAFDEQTHRAKYYNGTAIGSVVTTIDVDDVPVDSATTDPISSNWAYDHVAAADPHPGYLRESLLDAAGDIIYASANDTPARLPIGLANKFLRVNAGATAPEWANGALVNKLITVSHDLSVTGDESYTGTGFTPVALIAVGGTAAIGSGACDSSLNEQGSWLAYDYTYQIQAFIGYIQTNSAPWAKAIVKSLDADGFTLTWSKSGTPTGTATWYVLAFA
jgi:hypothetical protein